MELFLTQEMYQAFTEMSLGVMSLRIPAVQDYLFTNFPKASIKSSYDKQDAIINCRKIISVIRQQGSQKPANLRRSFTEITKVLLISTWQILKDTKTYHNISTKPDIQFFKHIRNGCAHDNKFNFDGLKHPAYWRDKKITIALKDATVVPDFIKDGDPLLMLLDINNTYFQPIQLKGYKPYY